METRRKSEVMRQVVFIGPSLLLFVIVVVIPFIMGLYYSMTSWNGVSKNVVWVGISNYKTILMKDTPFKNSFWFTTRFTLMTVLFVNALGFFLAYYLSKQIRGRNLMRTIFFMPNVLGGVLLGFIWRFIFIQGFTSVGKLTNIHFFKLSWLGTSSTGFWALVIVSVWQMAGYLMVIYIAGLSAVPEELIEAAKLDGASEWKVFKNITFPLILPTFTVCVFYTVNHAYKMYDLNYSLTTGGPYRSTESLTMNIINEAFTNNRYGLGTAKAVILFILIAFITGLQYNLTKKREVEM